MTEAVAPVVSTASRKDTWPSVRNMQNRCNGRRGDLGSPFVGRDDDCAAQHQSATAERLTSINVSHASPPPSPLTSVQRAQRFVAVRRQPSGKSCSSGRWPLLLRLLPCGRDASTTVPHTVRCFIITLQLITLRRPARCTLLARVHQPPVPLSLLASGGPCPALAGAHAAAWHTSATRVQGCSSRGAPCTLAAPTCAHCHTQLFARRTPPAYSCNELITATVRRLGQARPPSARVRMTRCLMVAC